MARRTCFDCDNCDKYEVKDGKVWCKYYHSYYDPDDAYNCNRFEMGTSGSGGCYLTTACVDVMGLADNCRELNVLRSFRDGYMSSQPQGEMDIKEYYCKAPDIITQIAKCDNYRSVYKKLYSEVIVPCVQLIENGEYEIAYQKYKQMVLNLEEEYLLN